MNLTMKPTNKSKRIKINRTKAQRIINKTIFVLTLIVISVFLSGLSACGSRPPVDIPIFVGKEGMEIEFLENAPPDKVYEESAFSVNLFVENRGAFNVVGENYGILSIGFDPFYVDAINFQESDNIQIIDDALIYAPVQLPGKSRHYPYGMETILSFANFNTTRITGQREQPTTQIFVSLCYPYITQLSKMICVDHTVIAENLRKQVCYQKNLVLSDQGAPLAITLVEVENQPVRGGAVRPVFTIHVKNIGSGTVISPMSNLGEFERVCTFQNLYKEDFNTIDVRAKLSHSTQLYCNPNPIKLFGGEGFTRCSVRDEDLTVEHQNYETPLSVNLSYIYTTVISKTIKIKRLNIYGDLTEPGEECPSPYIEYEDRCLTLCDYCAQFGSNDPRCQPPNTYRDYKDNPIRISFNKSWACQCSAEECRKRLKTDCLFISGYCPGSNYCCPRWCSSSEFMFEGVCYPKCSTSKCGRSRSRCGCGTKETGYRLIDPDMYCCPDSQTAYPTEDVCREDPICFPQPTTPNS